MPRRGENIFRRKDGSWEARYVKAISTNNKKLYGSVYASTYTEVKQKRENICNSLNKERISFTVLGDSGLPFFPSFNKEAVNNSTCLVFNSFAFMSLKYGNK